MARILLAWELGGNYGHLAPLHRLATHLRSRGHECVFALRDLAGAERMQLPALGPCVQSPVAETLSTRLVQLSYASTLHMTGFGDMDALTARLRAWCHLLRNTKTNLLIAEHAPVALAAAHSLGVPTAATGTGFTLPPSVARFPSFQPQAAPATAVLDRNEAHVLRCLNQALERLHLTPFEKLQELFTRAERGLLGYAEMDHYCAERSEQPLGLPDYSHGQSPVWPEGAGPRLFGYLRPHKHLEPVLKALAALPARVLLHVAGADPRRYAALLRPGFAISAHPILMREAAAQCDAFVHYAGFNTTCEMLLAGKPGLLLPQHLEQVLVASRAAAIGAALTPPAGKEDGFNVSAALRQLLSDASLRNRAEAFAARYRGQDRSRIIPDFVDGVLRRFNIPSPAAAARA